LRGFRPQGFGKRGAWPGFMPAVAVLCLVLLAMLAVAQVAHLHPNQTDADHCQLCIVMHTVAPAAIAAAVIVIVQLGASAPLADPILIARQRQIRLFIRPPPPVSLYGVFPIRYSSPCHSPLLDRGDASAHSPKRPKSERKNRIDAH